MRSTTRSATRSTASPAATTASSTGPRPRSACCARPTPVKDQTYFLSHLSQDQVAKIEFPIGGYFKNRVRELAHEYDLANQARKDSQGICFLGKIKYNDFVKHYLGEKTGAIVDRETGKKLGEHKGFWFHTIGQRQGLGLGNGPWYVVGKDIDTNVVLVSHAEHRHDQERRDFVVGELTWIHRPPRADEALTCKLRHGPELLACTIQPSPDGSRLAVRLETGDVGIAPGQLDGLLQQALEHFSLIRGTLA